MILSDLEIRELAEAGMIYPFVPCQIRSIDGLMDNFLPVISYGLSSYGYDIRLSGNDFKIFRHRPGQVVDPKQFNPDFLERQYPYYDKTSLEYFVIPGNSYALGVAHEKITMPPDVTALAIGKSTYARCGIVANLTPIEAGWTGYLTIELSNSSSADVRVYANEGICQLLFFRGNPCQISYETRQGKYQGQQQSVTLPRV